MREESLYFIALVPPEPILGQLWEYKREASERFGCKAALNSPPHVTLHMPFRYRADREQELLSCMEEFSKQHSKLSIETLHWSVFPPKVLFINVAKSDSLTKIQSALHLTMKKDLGLFNSNYKDQVFHPHITIAFRDLKKNLLQEAFTHFSSRNVQVKWISDQLTLLKHNGSHWEIGYLFKFKE